MKAIKKFNKTITVNLICNSLLEWDKYMEEGGGSLWPRHTDTFQTILTPDFGLLGKISFIPSRMSGLPCRSLGDWMQQQQPPTQPPTHTHLPHVKAILQTHHFYALVTDILQEKNCIYLLSVRKFKCLFFSKTWPERHHWDLWGLRGRKSNCIPWSPNFYKLCLSVYVFSHSGWGETCFKMFNFFL